MKTMKDNKRIPDPLKAAALILAFAGFLWVFAGIARASETGRTMKGNAGSAVSGDTVKPVGPRDEALPADTAQDAPALTTPKDKRSYALGLILGKQFRERSIEVDTDLYLRGLKDGLSGGRKLLPEAEARVEVDRLQSELKRKPNAPQAAGSGRPDIKVSFKLDPRLTRGLYMGDRWVSPPTFTSRAPEGTEVAVDARAEGYDAKGRATKISPRWVAADGEMVAVTPGEGKEVKISVKRAGETKLTVAAPGITKELSIKATEEGNAIRVEITQ